MEHRMKGRDSFTDGLILATIDLTAILSMQNVPSQESITDITLKKRAWNSSLW